MSRPEPNVFRPDVHQYCVERRNPETGVLDLRGKQPPFMTATAEDLYRYYFRSVPADGRTSVSYTEIGAWYAQNGWFWRPKTW